VQLAQCGSQVEETVIVIITEIAISEFIIKSHNELPVKKYDTMLFNIVFHKYLLSFINY
jgi:hypothetical protein